MAIIKTDGEYFSVKDTLQCGQIFRYYERANGKFIVVSKDKCALCYNQGDFAFIECEDGDEEYFYNFFDLGRDYKNIVEGALSHNVGVLNDATILGKGIRILNQDTEEMLISFIVSQNNNIPRIKKSLDFLSLAAGKKIDFKGEVYYAFPAIKDLAIKEEEFFKSAGLGYRAGYIKGVTKLLLDGFDLTALNDLSTEEIKAKLISIRGVGEKVADCVLLFGFHRADSFPVDTWIEKVYREDFLGQEKDRHKITQYFINKFGEDAGYIQQYLFHYKRNFSK
jgi:N-glycosylase/DNA lyase